MTPALRKIVEAMSAEISRQTDGDFGPTAAAADTVIYAPSDGGSFDLEKVARAGLNAIKQPTAEILAAMRDTVPVDGHEWEWVAEDAPEHWAGMIDAILEGKAP